MYLRRYIRYLFLLSFLFMPAAPSAAGSAADSVIVKVGSEYALVDGAVYNMQAVPRISGGTTLVPLRSLAEVFGAGVSWDAGAGEITLRQGDRVTRLQPGSSEAVVDDAVQAAAAAPVVENGVTLVPLRFLAENLNYEVNFLPATREIHIRKLPPPNRPPVAEFAVEKDTVAQGETVIYEDKSRDPDGDEIVERKWTGKERAYFKPGEYKVTLQVKDSRGAWSEPYTRVIKVTGEVKMDELTYNLHNPVPGEPLDISNIPVLDLKRVDPAVTMNREKVMISNSPEVVREDGILYSDALSGENRLFYHHINGSKETKRIYLLAVNQGPEPVRLTVKKWGAAGPADPLSVGRAAAYRYLGFDPRDARFLELRPGEKVVLNEGTSAVVKPGQATHGIFDVNARGELLFAVVAVGSRDRLAEYEKLPVLSRDGRHIRGTFLRANRNMSVRLYGREPARLVVADGEDDSFMRGKDGRLVSRNKGNYGLSYRISIRSKNRVGVLFSPRGGVFAGAGAWDGEAFYLPNRGILQPKTGAVIGVVEAGKEKVLEFIPPAGSYLPVNLVFIPF